MTLSRIGSVSLTGFILVSVVTVIGQAPAGPLQARGPAGPAPGGAGAGRGAPPQPMWFFVTSMTKGSLIRGGLSKMAAFAPCGAQLATRPTRVTTPTLPTRTLTASDGLRWTRTDSERSDWLENLLSFLRDR